MDLKSIYEHAMIYAKQILIPFELMTSNNFNLINFYVDHNLWFSLYLLGAQFYQRFQFQKSFLPKSDSLVQKTRWDTRLEKKFE